MQERYIERILKARVYDVAIESPLEAAPRLSRRLGNRILFKREDLQPVFSFKLRGAYNKIAHLSDTVARRGVICASAGNHAQGVALAARRRGIPAVIVMPQTTPHDQGAGRARPRRRGGAARRRLRPRLRARGRGRARARPDVHPPVRRSGRDRGAGHDRHGDPAPALRADRRDLRADRRRRPDRRHRGLREVAVPADPHHRRRARGRGQHARLAAGRAARDARARRHLRRRRRGAPRRRGDVPARAAVRRRGDPGLDRRDLRRDPGHLRGHPHDRRAGRRARASPASRSTSRARVVQRAHAGRDQLRRQHQLRPPAPRRRARRHRRAARGAAGGRDPGGAGQLPALLPAARPAQRHRVQLPLRRRERGAHLRRRRAARGPAREGRRCSRQLADAGYARRST